MAKIEMDLSEYEKMMENKKLLEKSLENERSLQEQVKKLNEEKIKAYEDAKMKVVKTTYVDKRETKYLVRSGQDLMKELRNLFQLLTSRNVVYADAARFTEYESERIISAFFQTFNSSGLSHEETTMHGLDEVKAEIRKELQDNMDAETKHKLSEAEKANKQFSEVVSQKDKLIKEVELLREQLDVLSKDNKQLTEEKSALQLSNETLLKNGEQNLVIVSNVRRITKGGHNIFNRAQLLNEIVKTLNHE